MAHTDEAYRTIITELDSEIREREAQIRKSEASIREQESRILEAKTTITALRRRLAAIATPAPVFVASPVLMEAAAPAPAPRLRKGDVVALVLEKIRTTPGITSAELADALEEVVVSPAADKRKLIHSTASYLNKKGRLKKEGRGWFEYVAEKDDDDLGF